MFEDIIKPKRRKLKASLEPMDWDTSVFAGIDGVCDNVSRMSKCPNYEEQDVSQMTSGKHGGPVTCKYFLLKGGQCRFHLP
jgi:hypothetical protein